MADTTSHSTLDVTQWERDFFEEYVRSNEFAEYTGADNFSLIHVNENLTSNPGSNVVIPLVGALSGAGVTGSNVLEGNEEALSNYGHTINASVIRNAVKVDGQQQADNAIDVLNAGRSQLMAWIMDKTRDDVITALHSIDGTAYASATEAARDTWNAANSDRILFGAVKSNQSGDQSADVANCDNTTDKMDAGIVSLAKRIARTASPAIRPFRVADRLREEWYVFFMNSLSFRDLKADTTIATANREAWNRGKDNPIFRDGDLIYDGVICREVPAIGVLSGAGASGIDAGVNFLCGAQAVGIGYKQRTTAITNTRDYGFATGVGVMENRGIEKLQSNFGTLKDHGVVTVYTSAVADS